MQKKIKFTHSSVIFLTKFIYSSFSLPPYYLSFFCPSCQVSFIRRPSETSCANSTGSSASTADYGPGMTQFYIQAESPSGLGGMHFRWPRMPWERKKVSWSSCDGDESVLYGGDVSSGETQRHGGRKIFTKEKHPFALFQV